LRGRAIQIDVYFTLLYFTKVLDFKFGIYLLFAKGYHKIAPRGKSKCGLGLGELPKNFGIPYNIFSTAEASDFNFGAKLEFGKAHHKITRRKGDLALD